MKTLMICTSLLLLSQILPAHPGIGIVMDPDGNIFYTDLVHVQKISPEGNRNIAVRNVHTHELYMDERGDLYGEHLWYKGEATDKWGTYVWCLSKDGILEKYIPDVEGLLENNTLVRDNAGGSYFTQKSGKKEILKHLSPDGEIQIYSDHLFEDIRWMHYSGYDHKLYVVDQLSIKNIDSDGKVKVIAHNLKAKSSPSNEVSDGHYVLGVWTDQNKNVYAALLGARQVKKITLHGKISTVYQSEPPWAPSGGLSAADGTLWILEVSDTNHCRVKKITPGNKQTIFGD